MDFAPTEHPEGRTDGPPAGQPAYLAAVQPVVTPARRSRPLIAGAILAGAIGLTAVAVGLASTGTPAVAAPAAAPAIANARGVLLGADTGTWTAPNGGTATAPNMTGMMGDRDGNEFGPGGFGPGAGMGRGGRMGGGRMLASISITTIDGTKLALTTADGWTRTIDAAGATVKKSGNSIDLATLKVGDSIIFDQARQADGTYKITAIQVVLPHADGTVKSVSASSVTLTRRDGTEKVIQLTGTTTYQRGGATSTKAALIVGAEVDAEGTTTTDGTFTATLVNVRPALAGGTVTAKTTTSITVTTRDGTSLKITVATATTYQVADKTAATLSDVAVGAIVMAEGTRNADGTFSATVVRAFAAGSGWGPGAGPGMRGGDGMPWGPGMPVPQATPPDGTTT